MPIGLIRAEFHLSQSELHDIDEPQLEAYLGALPKVMELRMGPLARVIAKLLAALFSQ